MSKKRVLALILAATMVFSIVGCGENETVDNEKKSDEVESVVNSKDEGSSDAEESSEEQLVLPEGTIGMHDWPAYDPVIDYTQPYNKRYDGVTYTRFVDTAGMDLPEGMTIDENDYTWMFQAVTGLKPETIWSSSGSGYGDKLRNAIMSGDIADLMCVEINQYYKLVKAGLIADLTDALLNEEHPNLQALYSSANNQHLDTLKVDGRIYGIPVANAQYNNASLVWIRKDWLDKLGLAEPTCYKDLEEIALAFIQQDPDGDGAEDTIGIPMYGYFHANNNGYLGDFFLNVGGAAPHTWQYDEDGSLIYGSLMDGAKEALTLLNDWYGKGIIPEDFALWSADTVTEAVSTGRAGIVFAPWYASVGVLANSIALDQEAEWQAYMLPGEAGEEVFGQAGDPVTQIYVVSNEVEDPSMFVYAYDLWCGETADYTSLVDAEDYKITVSNSLNPMYQSMSPTVYYKPITVIKDKVIGTEELSTKEEVEDYMMGLVGNKCVTPITGAFATMDLYKAIQLGADPREVKIGAWDKNTTYTKYLQWWVGTGAIGAADPTPVVTAFQGTTDSMSMYNTFLDTTEYTAYINMIMGNTDGLSVSEYFDNFVAEYLDQGGAEILEEVKETLGIK